MKKSFAVFNAAGFGDLPAINAQDAFPPIGGEIHDLDGHAAETAADGRRRDEIAHRLHAEQIDRTRHRIDLVWGKP